MSVRPSSPRKPISLLNTKAPWKLSGLPYQIVIDSFNLSYYSFHFYLSSFDFRHISRHIIRDSVGIYVYREVRYISTSSRLVWFGIDCGHALLALPFLLHDGHSQRIISDGFISWHAIGGQENATLARKIKRKKEKKKKRKFVASRICRLTETVKDFLRCLI